jgi:hypothetical protein
MFLDSNGKEISVNRFRLLAPEARYFLHEGELKHLFDIDTWKIILPSKIISEAQLFVWYETSGVKWENIWLLSDLYKQGFYSGRDSNFINTNSTL